MEAFAQEAKENAYKSYIADCVRLIGENVFYLTRGEGAGYYGTRWADLENPSKEDERTGDEIALDVMRRAGIKFKE